jgi:hypothetical protein
VKRVVPLDSQEQPVVGIAETLIGIQELGHARFPFLHHVQLGFVVFKPTVSDADRAEDPP